MASEKLKIDIENAAMGNRALASVLLLYYHLLREGGITNDQTVYVNSEDFDPFKYVGAEVSIELSDIDQKLLQEGAVVLLLCDLNDLIGEYESDYLKQPHVKRILAALSDGCEAVVPEIAYFSDRGRPFQIDHGRCFNRSWTLAWGVRATGSMVAQSSMISMKRPALSTLAL